MSTTIDQKVVEMRFDNRNFEKNVATTMSTLDRFKQKLKFSESSKGLEELERASRKLTFNPMSRGVQEVTARFKAMDAVAFTAINRITNSVMSFGERLGKTLLGINALRDGFEEYSLTMNTIQTLVNSTGKSMDYIKGQLAELDDYADKTVYSTKDMFSNIYKFTNAGVDLETAKTAMIGIANATAYAGQGAQQASIAYYNLAQSLASGYLTRVDYKSLALANITTDDWKKRMVEAAIAAGTLTKAEENLYKIGEKEFTLQSLFSEGLQEQWATNDVIMSVFKEYGDASTEIGYKAWKAAQEVKTYSGMMESLSAESATSWKKTFEIIIGDLEQAKKFWSGLKNFISGIADPINKFRNDILESAFFKKIAVVNEKGEKITKTVERALLKTGEVIDKITGKINVITGPINNVATSVSGLTKTAEEYNQVVNEIINGDWGNTEERWNRLTEAGYDWCHAQNLVNERLGFSLRRATSYTDAQQEMAEATSKNIEMTFSELVALDKTLSEREKAGLEISDYSKEEIKAIHETTAAKIEEISTDAKLAESGKQTSKLKKKYNDEQIEALKQLQKVSEETGVSIEYMIRSGEDITTRWLFLDSFKQLGEALMSVLNAISKAFRDVFFGAEEYDQQIENAGNGLYRLIAAFHRFSARLNEIISNKQNVENLTNTFRGLFAVLHMITSIIGFGFKVASSLFLGILKAFNVSVLNITGTIGNLLYRFDQWIRGDHVLIDILMSVGEVIGNLLKRLWDFISHTKAYNKAAKFMSNALSTIRDKLNEFKEGIKNTDNIPKYIMDGLKNGFQKYLPGVYSVLSKVFGSIIDFVCNILGIHSPSTVFFDIGKNIMAGLVNGLKAFVNGVFDVLGSVVDGALRIFHKIDWGKILAVGLAVGLLYFAKKLIGILGVFASAVKDVAAGVGSFLSGLGSWAADTGAAKKINAQANLWEAVGKSIFKIAMSIVAIALIPKDRLGTALAVIGTIGGIIAALVILGSITGGDKSTNILSIKMSIPTILAACLGLSMVAKAIGKLAKVDAKRLKAAMDAFTKLMFEMFILLYGLKKLIDLEGVEGVEKAGILFAKLSTTVLILAIAMKMMGKMKPDALNQGITVLTLFFGFITGLILVTKKAGPYADKAGMMLWRVAVALIILTTVMKIIGKMKPETIVKGLIVLGFLAAYIKGLIAISKKSGKWAGKAGLMMIAIGTSLLFIATAMKIIASMDVGGLAKATIVLGVLTLLIDSMIAVSKKSGKYAIRAGIMIMTAAIALTMMTAALFIISKMNPEDVKRATAIVSILVGLIDSMVLVSGKAKKASVKEIAPLIALTVMFAVLVAAVVGLTFVDQEKLVRATACVSIIMGAMAALVASTKNLKVGTKTLATLAGLTLILGALGLVVWMVASLAPEGAIGAAISLSILIMAMAATCVILKQIGRFSKSIYNAMGAMLALVGIVAILAAVLNLLHGLDPVASIGNVVALSILLGVLAGVVIILGKLGGGATNALIGVGIMALLALVVAGLAFILKMLDGINPAKAIQNVITLSVFLGVLSIMLLALTGIGALAVSTGGVILAGIAGLYALIPALLMLTGILALMGKMNPSSNIQNAEALSILLGVMSLSLIALSTAGMLAPGAALGIVALLALTKLMPGIVNILKMMEKANLQNGLRNALALSVLLNAFSSVLVILAMVGMTGPAAYNGILALTTLIVAMGGLMLAIGALSKHMPKMEEFINKGIDILCQVAYGIGKFIGSFVGGITAGIVSGLPEIGLRLSQFMILAMPFIQGAKQVDKKALTGIGILTASIIALCAAELITSITKFLTLGGTFADLGTQLSMFMLNATPFIMGLKMISPQLAKAAKNMAETVLILTAADMVQGLSRFLGLSDKDPFTKLSTQLEAFGDGMIKFYDKVKGIENVDKFKTAAEGAKYLVEVAKSIPNEGGLAALFAGDNTLEGFGKGITSFGKSMVSFAKSISELDDDKIDKIRKSAKAGEAFTKMAKTIPNDGGLFSIFAGDNTLKGFSKGITEYGKALAGFGEKVVTITPEQAKAIEYSTKAGTSIIKMSKQIENEGGIGSIFTGNKSLANFSTNLKAFGEGIVSFATTITNKKSKMDNNKLKDIATMMQGISNTFKYMKDVNEKDAKSFKNALDTLAKVSLDKFVNSFDTQASSKIESVKTTLKTFIDGIVKAVRGYRGDFEKAGKHLVNGFANGITARTFKAEAAAKVMARKAKEAAEKELDENSPSKEFFKIGAFAGEGFINALYAYADKAYNASEDMAGSAKDGFSRAIASVAKTIENGIDDDLTIRPVLDLSNVEEGARSIADMLGSGQSIGTMANINAISTGINRNLQNRRSDEMLSAIKDLGKSLNNAGTTNNYNVNGVSYSGDEEISNAIETLVRAATVEGRV
jgi:hypothetical protein